MLSYFVLILYFSLLFNILFLVSIHYCVLQRRKEIFDKVSLVSQLKAENFTVHRGRLLTLFRVGRRFEAFLVLFLFLFFDLLTGTRYQLFPQNLQFVFVALMWPPNRSVALLALWVVSCVMAPTVTAKLADFATLTCSEILSKILIRCVTWH